MTQKSDKAMWADSIGLTRLAIGAGSVTSDRGRAGTAIELPQRNIGIAQANM